MEADVVFRTHRQVTTTESKPKLLKRRNQSVDGVSDRPVFRPANILIIVKGPYFLNMPSILLHCWL